MDNLFDRIRSFFIWWTGVDTDIFHSPELRRLQKPYAGLGALALLSTVMAVIGAYSFIWSSLSSRLGAVAAALIAGLFMWAFDRSILGYISPNPDKAKFSNLIKLVINVTFSTVLALPLATDVLNGGIKSEILKKTESDIESIRSDLGFASERLSEDKNQLEEHLDDRASGNRADGTRNLEYEADTRTLRQSIERSEQREADLMEQLQTLEQERGDYRTGSFDNRNPEFSFPQKLNRVLSAASDDNALPLGEKLIAGVTFLLSAIAGAGAVLARTIFIGADSYSKRWRAEETIACENEELKLKIARSYLSSGDFMDKLNSSSESFIMAMSNSIRESMLEMVPRRGRHPEVYEKSTSYSASTNSVDQDVDELWKSHNEGADKRSRDVESIFSLFSEPNKN